MHRVLLPVFFCFIFNFSAQAQLETIPGNPGKCVEFNWDTVQNYWNYLATTLIDYSPVGGVIGNVQIDTTSGDTVKQVRVTINNQSRTIITDVYQPDTSGKLVKTDSTYGERDAQGNVVANMIMYRDWQGNWQIADGSRLNAYAYDGQNRVIHCNTDYYTNGIPSNSYKQDFEYDQGTGQIKSITTSVLVSTNPIAYEVVSRQEFEIGGLFYDLRVVNSSWDSINQKWDTTTRRSYNFKDNNPPDYSSPDHFFATNKITEDLFEFYQPGVPPMSYIANLRIDYVYDIFGGYERTDLNYNLGTLSFDTAGRREIRYDSLEQKIIDETFVKMPPGTGGTWTQIQGERSTLTYSPLPNQLAEKIVQIFVPSNFSQRNKQKFLYSEFRQFNSINELYFDGPKFTVYPNPVAETVTLHHHEQSEIEFTLTDSEGKVIRQIQKHQSGNIYLGDLPAGLYLIQAIDEYGNRSTKQIIKR